MTRRRSHRLWILNCVLSANQVSEMITSVVYVIINIVQIFQILNFNLSMKESSLFYFFFLIIFNNFFINLNSFFFN
jgi:hypothetical protein